MGLNMKRKEKITIACGLSLGVFAGACSIFRTVELQSLSSMENYVYDTASMLLWSSSEVCLTIVCACIPVLRPLYVKIVYGTRGDSSGKNSYPLNEYSNQRTVGVWVKVNRKTKCTWALVVEYCKLQCEWEATLQARKRY